MQKMPKHAHTLLTHSGRQKNTYGSVNPRVVRASTMLFPNTHELKSAYGTRLTYGRHGTETTFALEETLCKLEKADDCILSSSGLAAVTTALLAFLNTGDHLLISDSVYDPTRDFCDHFLNRMGIQTTYYDPEIGENIEALIQSNTKVIFVESPGSLTFEVQDIPAIARAAHRHGIVVIADSTWATPLGWKAFELGINVSLHAATKYIVGHADVLMGAILCQKQHQARLRQTHQNMGHSISSDDAYLALRGLRTLAARLAIHRENSQAIVRWLLKQPEVEHILYPPHPQSSGHTLWKRDFNPEYACGLMGVIFYSHISNESVEALINTTQLFGIGFSWGGYESLIIPANPTAYRTVTSHKWQRPMIRLHIGLEAAHDLIADLEEGFNALRHIHHLSQTSPHSLEDEKS